MTDAYLTRRADIWALAIIALLFLTRLWFIASGQFTLVQDEAQYWDWTRRLQLSYYSKGPLIAWLIHFWTGLFGDTQFGVRIGALVNSTLSAGLLYWWLARIWQRPKLGLWTLVVGATMPLFLGSGLFMTPDNPLMLCWLACLVCMDLAGRGRGGLWPYLVFAVALAAGILAKYMMLAVLPTLIVYGVGMARMRALPKGFAAGMAWASLAGTALGMAPILVWNVQNDWVGFKHVFHLTGMAGKRAQTLIRFDRFPDYIGSQIALSTPWWLGFMLVGGVAAVRRALGKPAATLGLDRDRALLLAAAFWPVWGGIFLWSFHTKILGNWPAMSYVGGIVLAAAAFEHTFEQGRELWRKAARVWLALGLVVFVVLHFASSLPLPRDVNPALRLKGWADLGERVEQYRKSAFADPDRVFIFSDNYDMTAALSFYVPGRPITYSVDTGRRLSQYDIWPGPQDKAGWDAVYVKKNFQQGPVHEAVKGMFERIDGPIKYQTTFRGEPARRFTIYLCYGYNGNWPRISRGDY